MRRANLIRWTASKSGKYPILARLGFEYKHFTSDLFMIFNVSGDGSMSMQVQTLYCIYCLNCIWYDAGVCLLLERLDYQGWLVPHRQSFLAMSHWERKKFWQSLIFSDCEAEICLRDCGCSEWFHKREPCDHQLPGRTEWRGCEAVGLGSEDRITESYILQVVGPINHLMDTVPFNMHCYR